ncbi:MAG: hypothetical protein NTW60_02565, partial [Candidatus Wolfebacteria bacterium]|nr:hypothetical protein [Candidatus Wolfebacteria bacterium]
LVDAAGWAEKAREARSVEPKGLSPEKLALCGSGEAQAFRWIVESPRPDWGKLLPLRLAK